MSSKTTIGKRNISATTLDKRQHISRTSNVSIVYWHYVKENFGTSSNVQSQATENQLIKIGKETVKGVISGGVASCTITKDIDQASASFNVSLLPSQNWRQVISPGDWVAIYFHSAMDTKDGQAPSGTKNLVLVGNIDRVSRTIQKEEESDATQLRYNLSGRNFGKVFEQTDIWYDPYDTQEATLDVMLRKGGLEIAGNPGDQVTAALNVFLGDGHQFGDERTSGLNQWIIPDSLAQLFGAKGSTLNFDSILDRQIVTDLPGYHPRNLLTPNSNGSLWDFLKRSSNHMFNEVYLEEVRDDKGNVKPTILLKPRPFNTPFFDSQFGGEKAVKATLKSGYKTLQKLAEENYIEISQSEIIYENLGRDDHSRINMLWMETSQQLEFYLSTTANVDGANTLGNPTYNRGSIQRHGLRRMDSLLEFTHSELDGGVISTDINLYKAFMAQLYDMNYANHLYEQGTIECSGVLEAELGKALIVKAPTPSAGPDKIYFIEGYEHKWSFPNTWSTTFTVTKGQFKDSQNPFIDVMGPGDFGQADKSINVAYVAKTQGKK